jgi:hypothetical protein
LRVLDPPGGAGVLPLHACCGGALLDVSRLIGHQHRGRVAKVLDDITPQIIADAVGVPPGAREQVLHPVRRAIPGMLGDCQAVLARQFR